MNTVRAAQNGAKLNKLKYNRSAEEISLDLNEPMRITLQMGLIFRDIIQDKALLKQIEEIDLSHFDLTDNPLSVNISGIIKSEVVIESIKKAHDFWKSLGERQRCTLLFLFYNLFEEHLLSFSKQQKMELFLKIFLSELVPFLLKYCN